MKTIIVNASPRKSWNTAQLLKEAQKGAESVGAETEYVDLYSLDFTGCRSCMACKLKNGKHPGCAWKDDLSPLIDRIFESDALIIGTPIYFSEPTAGFRAFLERLVFCAMPYQQGSYFNGRVNAGFVYTMNAWEDYYEKNCRPYLQSTERLFQTTLKGDVRSYAAFETLQVNDYSRYDMAMFDGTARKARRETQFPIDRENVYRMGAELSR